MTGNMKIQGDLCVSQCASGFSDHDDGYNCIKCNGTCPTSMSSNLSF